MPDVQALIPPPPVVRERLAQHIREGRLLRSLYRLSVRAAEERHQHARLSDPIEPRQSKGGA